MPIFEYRCKECATEFEKIIFRSSESIECPNCGSAQSEKLLSSFAVQAESSPRVREPGPCPCGAAERGMCQAMSDS
ncbi:MAG TPA: zinc ribbon domain-containing protein [Acidobacteriota bacterium]|nr:zinc ribbon domain-containing protein [Acidobacteriota bacterium]